MIYKVAMFIFLAGFSINHFINDELLALIVAIAAGVAAVALIAEK